MFEHIPPVPDYLQVLLESGMIIKETEQLSDSALVDEVIHIVPENQFLPQTDEAFSVFFKTGKLPKKQRKLLEGVYALFHTRLSLDCD